MRYLCISVALVLMVMVLVPGCSGDPDKTGIPIYNLGPNQDTGDTGDDPDGPVLVLISIEPGAANIEIGGHQIYKAYGRFSDNSLIDITGTVNWYSTNVNVGTLDDKGVFSAKSVGWSGVGASYAKFGENPQIVYANYSFANVFPIGLKPLEPVRNVQATIIGNVVVVSWQFSSEADVKGYNVYRSRISGEGYDPVTPLNDELITLNYYEDINPGNGILYYVVAAVDMDDEVGAFSQEVELDFYPEPPEEDWEP